MIPWHRTVESIPAQMAGCGFHPWDAMRSTTLLICCSVAAALALGWIRKTKAMSTYHEFLFPTLTFVIVSFFEIE